MSVSSTNVYDLADFIEGSYPTDGTVMNASELREVAESIAIICVLNNKSFNSITHSHATGACEFTIYLKPGTKPRQAIAFVDGLLKCNRHVDVLYDFSLNIHNSMLCFSFTVDY